MTDGHFYNQHYIPKMTISQYLLQKIMTFGQFLFFFLEILKIHDIMNK